jgi:hypothetical protein
MRDREALIRRGGHAQVALTGTLRGRLDGAARLEHRSVEPALARSRASIAGDGSLEGPHQPPARAKFRSSADPLRGWLEAGAPRAALFAQPSPLRRFQPCLRHPLAVRPLALPVLDPGGHGKHGRTHRHSHHRHRHRQLSLRHRGHNRVPGRRPDVEPRTHRLEPAELRRLPAGRRTCGVHTVAVWPRRALRRRGRFCRCKINPLPREHDISTIPHSVRPSRLCAGPLRPVL